MNKTYKTLVILIVVLVIVAIGAWAIVGMHSNNTAATAVQTNPGAPIETSVTMTSTTTTTTATTTAMYTM
jgi:flagellar basal body-associated protein FliL